MKRPDEAIARLGHCLRKGYGGALGDWAEIRAYLDSIKEWPKDLTRERLIGEADFIEGLDGERYSSAAAILRRLAELAPGREKRKYEAWRRADWESGTTPVTLTYGAQKDGVNGWRKVHEFEIED